jgi:pimeloyl-ACP methyl ester carboxylesterase
MSQFFEKDVLVNNLKLHTEAFGKSSNPACILIAGKMSTARFWTDVFCQFLANQGFFIIRYDHRDVGESSEIDWQEAPYTMSDLAKDAITIMDGYGIKKAHFVGDSMGGWICQRIGVDYPERVLSFVIISAGPIEIIDVPLTVRSKKEQEILDNTTMIFNSRKDGKNLAETIQNFLPIWLYTNAEIPLDKEMAENFTRDFLVRTKNKNFMNHELMMQDFLSKMKKTKTLSKIDKPVLVVHGDKDPVVLPRHGKAVADTIPQAKFVMIKGMGHTFFNRALEEKIAKLVIDHLKQASKKLKI